ncbi:3921_t:CDS:2, partial [Diversispora eburnea]
MNNLKRKVGDILNDSVIEKKVQNSGKKKAKVAAGNGEGSSNVKENGDSLSKKSKQRQKTKSPREAKFKQICNKDTKKRIERALTQRMYLVNCKEINPTRREYTILGPTGCAYTTVITNTL